MITKIPLNKLLPHEETLEEHFRELLVEIKSDGFLLRPIAVSRLDDFGKKGYFLIHDGHHRIRCLKALGCKYTMANVVDFWSDKIKVFHYYDLKKEFPKEKILDLALKGKDLKPRTTKHFIRLSKKSVPFHNNDIVEPKIYTLLSELK